MGTFHKPETSIRGHSKFPEYMFRLWICTVRASVQRVKSDLHAATRDDLHSFPRIARDARASSCLLDIPILTSGLVPDRMS